MVLVDFEQALKSLSVSGKPFMLDALLGGWSLLRLSLEHPLNEKFAFIACVCKMHLNLWSRINFCIANHYFIHVYTEEQRPPCEKVVKITPILKISAFVVKC